MCSTAARDLAVPRVRVVGVEHDAPPRILRTTCSPGGSFDSFVSRRSTSHDGGSSNSSPVRTWTRPASVHVERDVHAVGPSFTPRDPLNPRAGRTATPHVMDQVEGQIALEITDLKLAAKDQEGDADPE